LLLGVKGDALLHRLLRRRLRGLLARRPLLLALSGVGRHILCTLLVLLRGLLSILLVSGRGLLCLAVGRRVLLSAALLCLTSIARHVLDTLLLTLSGLLVAGPAALRLLLGVLL
jgi:hypothetical protein